MGPMGPQGPQGPEGPAGLSGYEKLFMDHPAQGMNPGTSSWFVALCPQGKRPLSGGYELLGGSGAQLNAIASHPYDNNPTFGWRVQLRNNTGIIVNTTVRVHVICGALPQ